jgi:hypothetical protein
MQPYTLTYVAAFLDIYPDQAVKDFIKKPINMRFETFRQIAKTKIPIVVFLDPQSAQYIQDFKDECNLHIIEIPYENLTTYKDIKDLQLNLPPSRCTKKDTVDFMVIMNAKAEFMKRAKDSNPFHTTHFAWMDFSLGYVFKDHENTYKYLQELCYKPLKTPIYAIPGCWQKGASVNYIHQTINWRFCGGFYIADAESIEEFYTLYRRNFRTLCEKSGVMIWETNIWALLELYCNWNPTWYLADHNDSICKVPDSCFL